MKTTISVSSEKDDEAYEDFIVTMRYRVESRLACTSRRVFTTDAVGMFDSYLDELPAEYRQHYNCNCCRRFLDTYGGLCFISSPGLKTPLLWDFKCQGLFKGVVKRLYDIVDKAKITGVFISKDKVLGTPVTGEWKHLHVINGNPFNELTSTAYQKAAAIKEDYGMLQRVLESYSTDTIRKALFLLKGDDLFRSEKVEGNCQWLLDLSEYMGEVKNLKERDNLFWYNAANAPAGFCHVRAGVLGTLLDDVANKVPFHALKDRFNEKLDPIKYRRPQVAPAAGNIAQAEKLMEPFKESLKRRFARFEEIVPRAIWLPKKEEKEQEGIFGHLKKKGEEVNEASLPLQVITWAKFNADILSHCTKIEMRVGHSEMGYFGFLTAEDPSAPPIIQWDHENYRNPMSWYMYAHGAPSVNFKLSPGYVPVKGISMGPFNWSKYIIGNNFGDPVFAFLEGAKDKAENISMGLFPEILRSEFHPIRATIEAYSRSKNPSGYEQADAFGNVIRAGAVLRCHMEMGFVREYKIDRME